jgi:hypothetical protein
MPEEQTEPTTEAAPETQTEPAAKEEPDWKAEAEKWKALSRKHESTAKANATAASKLKELEDADKSDVEKLTSRATEAEKRAADAESRALRYEVAHEKGLTPAQAKRLIGTNREELEADADELLAAFRPSDDKSDKSRRPKEKLRPGASNESDDDSFDPKKLADSLSARPF